MGLILGRKTHFSIIHCVLGVCKETGERSVDFCCYFCNKSCQKIITPLNFIGNNQGCQSDVSARWISDSAF